MYDLINVLIVDDHLMMRSMLKKALLELGIQNIDEAFDGVDAMEKINHRKSKDELYDIVFVDWNMPRMDGKELVTACKADEYYEEVPFVMVTAERDQAKVVEALKSGVCDYIVKPFTPKSLGEKLGKSLKKNVA